MVDLARVGAGFSDAALGSQAVFRAALHALAHPGRLVELAHDAEVPAQGHAASAALLLALLDPGCSLWLSPSLAASDAAGWLRFHTGCRLTSEPGAAQFAWIAVGDELPPLERFAQGSDAAPDQSTTCVLDVPLLAEGVDGSAGEARWTLGGPGIDGSCALRIGGLPDAALAALRAQRAANHAAFPRGTDMFLATPTHVVGLPRTTRIEAEN